MASEIFKEKGEILEKKRLANDEDFTGPATLGKGLGNGGPGN